MVVGCDWYTTMYVRPSAVFRKSHLLTSRSGTYRESEVQNREFALIHFWNDSTTARIIQARLGCQFPVSTQLQLPIGYISP